MVSMAVSSAPPSPVSDPRRRQRDARCTRGIDTRRGAGSRTPSGLVFKKVPGPGSAAAGSDPYGDSNSGGGPALAVAAQTAAGCAAAGRLAGGA